MSRVTKKNLPVIIFFNLVILITYYFFLLFLIFFPKNTITKSLNPTEAPKNNFGLTLHRRDPEFIQEYIHKNDLSPEKKYELYKKLLKLDPKNKEILYSYLKFLYTLDIDKQKKSIYIQNFLISVIPDLNLEIKKFILLLQNKKLENEFLKIMIKNEHDNRLIQENIAKGLYLLGYNELSQDPSFTLETWALAYRFNPTLSYYAIEAASVAYLSLNDKNSAIFILSTCMNNTIARQHCEEILYMLTTNHTMLRSGFFYNHIEAL